MEFTDVDGDGRLSPAPGFLPLHMPQQHVQERMSSAYIAAVAARGGYSCTPTPAGSDYGQDFYLHRIRKVGSQFLIDGVPITVQAKSSVGVRLETASISYALDAQTYNHIIRQRKQRVPIVLVVLRMPAAYGDWLAQDEDNMHMRHCAYWTLLEGEETDNTTSKTISIPRTQVFRPEALESIGEACKEIMLAPQP